MAWPYEAYVSLLTDLLSTDDLPRGTLGSIAEHVGAVEDTGLARLASAMLQSPTLYRLLAYQQGSTSSQKAEAIGIAAAQDVFRAVRQGIANRLQKLKTAKGNTWIKRRRLQKTLEAFLAEVTAGQVEAEAAKGLKCLLLSSAILRAVQDDAARKNAFIKPDSALLRLCERHVCSSISTLLDSMSPSSTEQLPDDHSLLIAWVTAQVLPEIPSERLRSLANPTFFDFSFSYIRACFLDGHLLTDLSADVSTSIEGILWPETSTSCHRLKAVKGSLPHVLLGRFSRSLGKAIESISSADSFVLVLPQLERLETLAEDMHRDWAACEWSNATGAEDLHPDTRSRDEPWTIFKTLLFTLTMIFSSLISLMNATPLSTHRSPNTIVINLASCALRTFSSIFFITSKFGTNGFGAYQNVWYGAVDLVSRASPQKIEQIAKTCEPRFEVSQRRDVVLPAVLPRSRMTYWMNLVEQLVPFIPEEYVSVAVIPTLRPYLTDNNDTEAFESAHSVILAILNKRKALSIQVASWYSSLLLDSYPERLSISQLRLGYASMVGSVTDLESNEVHRCISKLLEAIESLPPGPSSVQSTDMPLAEVSQNTAGQKPAEEATGASAQALEVAALRSRRGPLLIVLIDQLSTVHLETMEHLLPKVQALLHEERRAPEESRVALVQVLFNTLSGAMDMVKRETAAKWWLENRAAIEEDKNLAEQGTFQVTPVSNSVSQTRL